MRLLTTLKRRKRRFYKSLALGAGVSILLSIGSYLGYLDVIEAKALDFLMLLRGQQRSPEIVLVQIDDDAFEKLGERQPLPRTYVANLIEIAARGGAKVIGVDIDLKVSTRATDDDRLLSAIQSAAENGSSKVVPVFYIRPVSEDDKGALFRRSAFFDSRLVGVAGFANAPVDTDGMVRQVPLAVRGEDGKIFPSLALAVAARYAGYDSTSLNAALRQEGAEIKLLLPEWSRLNGKPLPRNTPLSFAAAEPWRINFAGGRGSFATLPSGPLAALAEAKVPLAADNPFRGKIVLIGASFQDSRDFYPTPRGLLSGLEIHANMIHTILSRSRIAPAREFLAFAVLLVFTLISSLLITLFSPTLVTILLLAAIPLILVPLSYLAFAHLGLWVDFVTPLLAIRWGALAAEYLEGRHVRKSLGQYVGLEVAKQIVEQDEQLSGKKQVVTVFFTDVRNFTTLCEGLAPEDVVARMNEMFAMMGKVIERHGGAIFDFIGDAVLAVFGAPKENPDHAHAAAESALEIIAGLDELNARWIKNGLAPLRIGIGLHTGEVVAGIVGTGERKKFDVTGDTVNTGSRVEGLNKEFGTSILATRETVGFLNGAFTVRNCGEVHVKGREKPVEVFELLTPYGNTGIGEKSMKQIRSVVLLASLWFTLASTNWAAAQDAVAVITELKFNRGDIVLRSSSVAAPTKPAVLQSLYVGNVVQTSKDSVVVIFFTDGSRTVTVDEKNPSFEVKTVQAKPSQTALSMKDIASTLVGKKKPPSYVALSVRGKAQPPTLLSPRNTKLLSDAPTFQWMGMEQQPGTVKVFGPQGLLWSAENISLTKISYPASAPRLEPGVDYAWLIEKRGVAASRTSFKLLGSTEAEAIKARLKELSDMNSTSKSTLAVLKANFLMSKELFHDARDILTEAIAADADEPTLHFVLGELYDKVGLKNLAAGEYGEAEFLSKAKP